MTEEPQPSDQHEAADSPNHHPADEIQDLPNDQPSCSRSSDSASSGQ